MSTEQICAESLDRAIAGKSWMNYGSIYNGFLEKGIAEEDIKPRENVFTFNAWKALGRRVKKGEHGVRIVAFRKTTKTDSETGEVKSYSSPWYSTVFHVSQTVPIEGPNN